MRILIAASALVVLVSCGSSPSTNQSCTKALDAAELVIGKASDALGLASDAINGALDGDAQAVFDANDKLKALGDSVGDDADRYRRLAAECRGS